VREQCRCLEFCLGIGDEPTESLWVKISRETNIVVIVCYKLSDWGKLEGTFFRQLEEASCP